MMVINSFDLWQKDAFFSAAEEVQESADVLESAYRTWLRAKQEGRTPKALDGLLRDLQTALGTAKWQLEEFDRAVRLSHGGPSDNNSVTRRRQFVAAIENQLSLVETALRESLNEGGKPPLRWINLDKAECDDLAMFLSGAPGPHPLLEDAAMNPNEVKGHINDTRNNACTNYALESDGKRINGARKGTDTQVDKASHSRRALSLPDLCDWKIVIADEQQSMSSNVGATPKEKGSKPLYWWQGFGVHPQAKGLIHLRAFNLIAQVLGRVGGFPWQLKSSPRQPQFNRSVQFMLALVLVIFLIGAFFIL